MSGSMESSIEVFPDVTLVVNGRPRRVTARSIRAQDLGRRKGKSLLRAWPVFLIAIALGVVTGFATRPHHHRVAAALHH